MTQASAALLADKKAHQLPANLSVPNNPRDTSYLSQFFFWIKRRCEKNATTGSGMSSTRFYELSAIPIFSE
jgi:hypothetical protein